MAENTKNQELVSKIIADYTEDAKPHARYVKDVDNWYRAYRGILQLRSQAASWRSKLAPAYIYQVVETLTANVVDANPRWSVKPQARMASPQEIQQLRDGAKANELLLNEQIRADHLAEKKMLFAKQAFVAGTSVLKTYWGYQPQTLHRQSMVMEPDPTTGVMVPQIRRTSSEGTSQDNPCAEVVDVRDWIPHQSAVSLEKAMRVTHRCLYSFDELKRLEAEGVFGVTAGGDPVDNLKDIKKATGGGSDRETILFDADRTKDQIEVLEMWRRQPDGSLRVCAVANRAVLLRDMPSPFWHNDYPFVVCTPVPDLGRIHGISIVGQIVDLQDAAWSLLNQRMDNTEMLNNLIVVIRDDLENTDQLEWAPGAQWFVQSTDQVKTLEVSALPSQVSLAAEEKIKQDLQNIPGAAPALLGQQDATGGSQTATEVSLTTPHAQRRIALMKQQFRWADRRLGEQWMSLNQQFITTPRVIASVGQDGADAWNQIHPLIIQGQGDYYVDLEAMDESLMRQERRAEAQAKLQVAVQAVPVFAALAQSGQKMLNLQAFMDDYLDAFDISDKERYYSAAKPQMAPPGAPQGGPPGGPPAPANGVTAPQAYDATSPSHASSMSPMAAMQQMLSQSGGPNNVG